MNIKKPETTRFDVTDVTGEVIIAVVVIVAILLFITLWILPFSAKVVGPLFNKIGQLLTGGTAA